MKRLAIIGGGAAALMLATQIDTEKYRVTIYEKNKAFGRKFLVAGGGGLNLTYNASLEALVAQYSPSEFMTPIVRQFTNRDLMNWLNEIGVPTFIGSSNRVFPKEVFKPIEVLNKIIENIKANQVDFRFGAEWMGWKKQKHLSFKGIVDEEFDIAVFALGGASWKVTGSDGEWAKVFVASGVHVEPFRAANCAFAVDWNRQVIATHEGKPIKNITLSFKNKVSTGEINITQFGLEGNAIYPLSQKLQEALLTQDTVEIHLDLKPTMTVEQIAAKYHRSPFTKPTDVLNKSLNLNRAAIAILKQFTDKATFLQPERLAQTIKSIPIVIQSADALDKAISSLGGIALNEIDEHFQLKKMPNIYAIGEMLDWYAPTGGYLLQGCFSMGFALAKHLNALEE